MARKDRNGTPARGAPGSFEWHNRHIYGSYESGDPGGRTGIDGPGLSFRTDKEPMRAFRDMMGVLMKRGFSNAVEYDGPPLGLSDSSRELVPVEAVLQALRAKDGTAPPFGGFRIVMVLDDDEKVLAKVKVSRGTKVKLKLRGNIPKTLWDRIRATVRRKFHVDA